ncbi:hypothetical protein TSH100_27115 [Azospirillum sp. TSH100]|nr:hypothetical protein TSH100_27115 [Azospirillum sp. TSH100]
MVTREAVDEAIQALKAQGRSVSATAIQGLIGGTRATINAVLSDINEENRCRAVPQPQAGAPAIIDPSDEKPAELPAVVLAQADALMVSLADTLTATIRQERERARQERDAEREVHRAALDSERSAGEARAKALQGEIDALLALRAEMRDQLAEAGAEQEALQEALEAKDAERREMEVALDRAHALRDELTASLDVERNRVNEMKMDLLRAQADAAELRGRFEQRAADLEQVTAEARACLTRAVLAEANAIRLADELNEMRAAAKERPARDPAPKSRKGGAGKVRPPAPTAAKERDVDAVDAVMAAEDSHPPLPFGSAGGPVGSA